MNDTHLCFKAEQSPIIKKGKSGRKPIPIMARIARKIEIIPSGCWIWKGGKNNIGYGLIRHGDKKRMITVHRAAYIETHGPVPDGQVVMHTCPDKKNYLCCNPDHLTVGTRKMVINEMERLGNCKNFKYRAKTIVTCKHCGKTGYSNVMPRWHNDNCKHK